MNSCGAISARLHLSHGERACPLGGGGRRRVRGLCLYVKRLPPHPNPLPLVSLYGERQAFAYGRGSDASRSRRNSKSRWIEAHESHFQRFGIRAGNCIRAELRASIETSNPIMRTRKFPIDRRQPLLAQSVISPRCRIWSLSGHGGHRVSRTNQARFMCTRPKQSSQKHVPAKAGMAFPILGKNSAKTSDYK